MVYELGFGFGFGFGVPGSWVTGFRRVPHTTWHRHRHRFLKTVTEVCIFFTVINEPVMDTPNNKVGITHFFFSSFFSLLLLPPFNFFGFSPLTILLKKKI